MSEAPQRFPNVRRSIRLARVLACAGVGSILVVCVCLLAIGSEYLAIPLVRDSLQMQIAGGILLTGLLLAGALVLAAVLIFAWGAVDVALKIEANSYRTHDVLRDIHAALEEAQPQLRSIADNSQLSDTARAITHRARERTALRLAINEEIIRGDWEAAYALVDVLATRHGYKNEAARLRTEVDRSRELARDDELNESVERARMLMQNRDWDRARREMDRLLSKHPDSTAVRELPALFTKLRGEHKRRLLKAWDEAVQRNEIDHGIAVLRELDQFLTPNEAAALEESARGVFRAKLHNLGVRFSLAVTDHDWQAALEAARQIIEEFPNSRMAQEVKDRIPILTARADENATQTAAADAAP